MRRRTSALIKSNNPHLAGGEQLVHSEFLHPTSLRQLDSQRPRGTSKKSISVADVQGHDQSKTEMSKGLKNVTFLKRKRNKK